MSSGKARNILTKNLLFHLICQFDANLCYRCREPIDSADDLHIDHKKNWRSSTKPVDDYFNPSNLAFSHPRCNTTHQEKQEQGNYRGVSFSKKKNKNKWRARIFVKGKYKHLGYFPTAEAAALAYNVAVDKYFGGQGFKNPL